MSQSTHALASAEMLALMSYLEHDAQPTILLDTDYNILAANTAYQRQFGVEGKPHVGAKCYRVSHQFAVPCDQAGEHCPMRKAFETRLPERLLHIHHTPRGPEHVDVELRPILGDTGQVVAYVERLSSVAVASVQPQQKGLVGRSPAFNEALSALQRAAPSQIPVLLQGESGTGKELFARALHDGSPRASGPLVVVDCTGLTETLLESELFGYEKGAFTGALQRKIGLAEAAHGGTLFLDEIGEVPLAMQVKLLRLIESGSFRPVGSLRTVHSDFRLVSATHKPLKEMVAAGTFRQDLYYRISAFPIRLPALRERSDDLPLLIDSLLQRLAPGAVPRVAPQALERLGLYAYPGNIRELRNILERARLFSDDGVIRVEDLPEELRAGSAATTTQPSRRRAGKDLEQLAHALEVFEGSRSELAKALGLSERTLYRRLKALGIS
ncbi:Transcriptional regulator containing PAS, AAA-type ATPase, and DNA-binding Fis domains [Pseudomonas chlororaphis]|uniref:sigma-54 interaction domain-containing protein n=1 Tax=Pseudomonas chlororaphis TaxID=587753 RepID=UPI00087C4CCB|nr:sigma 54-interacting transcriptional regulator [Pseudomonas chlororaphis]AZD66338.1 sigma-54-dependent transcriptional regulator [Pseudomonas chlororaphis subsp. aurantiaca]QIT22415.1 sigma 54-interacting transcriptional regulator [Pseudomonas chlororaphis subsp. aurantiaca]WDH06577.1 sigma 54-interacting transcriptional regulator [Pseudomonas chlororaphis]WDH10669.1 sigma 54-interacting transcriptional regulator [Pseudomonas chlororaphis]SDT34415.1 Transcriptional regulator containing PAS,